MLEDANARGVTRLTCACSDRVRVDDQAQQLLIADAACSRSAGLRHAASISLTLQTSAFDREYVYMVLLADYFK